MRSDSRYPEIDGLRGFACLSVVAHHCYFYGGRYQWPFGLPTLFSYGYLGVEIFFVLSGFCLANPLIARLPGENHWGRYAVRRARRILPAYWAWVIILTLVSILIARHPVPPLSDPTFLIVPNSRQFFYVFTLVAVWFVPVFWTLTVEARWYCILPFCIALWRRIGNAGLVTASIAISITFALLVDHLAPRARFIIGPLPLFLPLFAIGISLASLHRTVSRTPPRGMIIVLRCSLLLAIGLVGWLTPAHPELTFTYRRLLPGGLLATALTATGLFDPKLRKFFSNRLIVAVGLISYSLYLIHLPIIDFIHRWTAAYAWPEWQQLLVYQGLVLPLCVLLAYPFYVAFERPFLRVAASDRTAVLIDAHPQSASISRD